MTCESTEPDDAAIGDGVAGTRQRSSAVAGRKADEAAEALHRNGGTAEPSPPILVHCTWMENSIEHSTNI